MRTINGYKNPPGSTPWLVALEKTSSDQNNVCQVCIKKITFASKRPQDSWRQFCGAALIHPLFVISAAHCFDLKKIMQPESTTVVAGLSNIDGKVHEPVIYAYLI